MLACNERLRVPQGEFEFAHLFLHVIVIVIRLVSLSKIERRAAKMIRELRRLGYRVEPMASQTGVSA